MVPFESLRRQALALAGAPTPDLRDVCRLVSHLVKHVGTLTDEVADLRSQLAETRQDLQRIHEFVSKHA